MRICQILCGAGNGGLERHCIDLCNGLNERGHQVVLIARPEFSNRLAPGVEHMPLNLNGWRSNPILLMKLRRQICRSQPVIVHAQANKAAAMVATIAPFLNGKRVATVHNIKQHVAMFRRYDGVIAVSKAAALQLSHCRVQVIHNGIQPTGLISIEEDYAAHSLGRPPTRPLALAVGRLVPAKGFDLLIRAWAEINATLVIAGEGPDRVALEQLIEQLNLLDRVMLAGHRKDVPSLLADADLFVIASRREGFPYAMVEALHARKIIVATRVPGVDEVLPPKYVVECENVAALATRINSTLAELPVARHIYEQAWTYAAEELTVARMVERTEAFYRQVLEK